MRLNNYIIASLLSHLLLFSAITVFYRETAHEIFPRVVDVNIVEPLKENEAAPSRVKKNIPDTNKPRPVKPLIKRPVPESDDTAPKTIFGEGTDSELQKSNTGKEEQKPAEIDTSKKGAGGLEYEKKGVLPEGTEGLPVKPRSFLFDRETIDKYAKKEVPGEKAGKNKGLTFEAPELHHRGYMRKLKDKIESVWKYPEDAARQGIAGDLYIMFSILKDGSLNEVRLVRTSGHRDLDEAAAKALKNAAPYWPLPDDWPEDRLTITGHFIYILGSAYIM